MEKTVCSRLAVPTCMKHIPRHFSFYLYSYNAQSLILTVTVSCLLPSHTSNWVSLPNYLKNIFFLMSEILSIIQGRIQENGYNPWESYRNCTDLVKNLKTPAQRSKKKSVALFLKKIKNKGRGTTTVKNLERLKDSP